MIYIIIAIAAVAGLAFLISSGAGDMFGLSEGQFGAAVPLVVLLAVFLLGAMARTRNLPKTLGSVAIWVGIFGVVLVGYAFRDDLSGVAARVFGELVPGNAVVDREAGTATFRRGRSGHFEVVASVNGARIPLLFDTGATAVVLTRRDAEAAGIDTARLTYSIPVATANGTGWAAGVRLDSIDIGGIERRNVRAFVAEAGALDVSLLGMTYLETLSSYAVSSNSLILTD
jgi:aspartyl protease family protein